MIFFILIALVLASTLVTILRWDSWDPWYSLKVVVSTTVVASIAAGSIFAIAVVISNSTGEDVVSSTHELKALVTDSDSPGGYFFLGTGVVEDEPVYAFIMKTDDYYTVKSVPINDNARVVEGVTGQPYVEFHANVQTNSGFIAPFPTEWGMPSYTKFYIPAGSIYEGYSVAP